MVRAVKLVIQIVIILISLYVIRILRIPLGMISGNGNPVLLVIIPLIFLVLWFGVSWFIWLRELNLSRLIRILILTLSMLIMVSGTIRSAQYISKFKVEYKENFEKRYRHPITLEDVEIMTNGVSIHTNYLYFNYTTFLTLVSLLNIIAVGSSFLKPPKLKAQRIEGEELAQESGPND